MNTKQLWSALMYNPITEPYFDGIFPIDMLDEINKKPKLIICNTDPSFKKGQHWIVFYFNEDYVEFYDPLGNNISAYGPEFLDFILKYTEKYKCCKLRTQPYKSSLCGEYCLYFAYFRCNGMSMEKIISTMKSSHQVLDIVNDIFQLCKSSKCLFLHNCKKN